MTNRFHVTKDPVHGTMQFNSRENAWIKPFIDSPPLQRLRHIKQLGMGDFIFPGAVHTRFNHSLGCCYVASQIAHKIGLTDEDRQLVMIAGLLHDVGHGPFSHAFEDIFTRIKFRHEDWTPYFLADYNNAEFFADYNEINSGSELSQEKFRTIAAMIMHDPIHKKILADIVSSQLDADRLDYLLRDSHFCGVRYGEFDFRWMLHCMAIIPTTTGQRLGITHKGIGVVEHYLMARRLMMRNIYKLHKKLALEYLMVQFLAELALDLETNSQFKQVRQTIIGQFLIAVNQFNQEHQQDKQNFLQTNYQYYKDLCDYDIFGLIKILAYRQEQHPAIQIARRLQMRQIPKVHRLEHHDTEHIAQTVSDFKSKHRDIQAWQISLLKNPHRSYSKEDPILVTDENGNVQPISHFSLTIDALSDRTEQSSFICIDRSIAQDRRVQKLLRSL